MGFLKDHQKSEITTIIEKCIKKKEINYNKLNKLLEYIDLKDDKSIYEQQQNLMECCRCLRKSLKYGVSVNERVMALQIIDYIIENLDPEEINNENFILDSKLNANLKLAYIGKPYAWNKLQKGKEIKEFQDETIKYVTTIWNKQYPHFNSYTELYIDPDTSFNCDSRANSNRSRSSTTTSTNNRTSMHSKPVKSNKKKSYLKDKADPSVQPEDVQYGIPIIDAKKLSAKINLIVADANRHSTLLDNRLTELGRNVYSSDDELATEYFINVRDQRRKVLRYLQLVTEGEFLGILLKCNDDMVAVLDRYDASSNLSGDDEDYFTEEDEDDDDAYNSRQTRRDNSYFTDSDEDDEEEGERRSVYSSTNPFEDTFHI
ncbi:hypothetical protein HANVADRAFT_49894 [Hanseniaspora valbyensis NRRL Y-1626]|uniref:VHS domain-containing protein n=1 Tax=Hanseniaspora valbyensis NRRL Y-1626 TaxID=766949 RepID=A0A1B7TA68_9ASCO|nr:hypothetical protein HANVADRAFT_49894 [Hanseniaspora valbyensis NRRL Y-1626]